MTFKMSMVPMIITGSNSVGAAILKDFQTSDAVGFGSAGYPCLRAKKYE